MDYEATFVCFKIVSTTSETIVSTTSEITTGNSVTFLTEVIIICPDCAWEISWGPTCCLRKLVQSPVLLKKTTLGQRIIAYESGLLGMDESIYAFLDQAR